jgi:hypothetical protein
MPNVKNNSQSTIDFVVDVKDGQAVTDGVRPGESKNLDIDPDDPRVKTLVATGAITIEGGGRKHTAAQAGTAARTQGGRTE